LNKIQKAVHPESLQILKVKAAAQTRIKELEGIVAQNKQNYDSMVCIFANFALIKTKL
jgi:hypothetical protein